MGTKGKVVKIDIRDVPNDMKLQLLWDDYLSRLKSNDPTARKALQKNLSEEKL